MGANVASTVECFSFIKASGFKFVLSFAAKNWLVFAKPRQGWSARVAEPHIVVVFVPMVRTTAFASGSKNKGHHSLAGIYFITQTPTFPARSLARLHS